MVPPLDAKTTLRAPAARAPSMTLMLPGTFGGGYLRLIALAPDEVLGPRLRLAAEAIGASPSLCTIVILSGMRSRAATRVSS